MKGPISLIIGINCSACIGGLEKNLKQIPKDFPEVKAVSYHFSLPVASKAIIELHEKTGEISADRLSQILTHIHDGGYKAELESKMHRLFYYFGIIGLDHFSQEKIKALRQVIATALPEVEMVDINFSTNLLKIKCKESHIKEITTSILVQRINALSALKDKGMKIIEVDLPIAEVSVENNGALIYFKKSIINLIGLCSVFFIETFLSSYFGHGVSVLTGVGTAGLMYVTGSEFYKKCWQNKTFDMNTLIGLGTGSAWIYSFTVTLFPHFFNHMGCSFTSINMILMVINLGQGIKTWMQERSKSKTQEPSVILLTKQPLIAKRLRANELQLLQQLNQNPDLCINDLLYDEIDINEIKPGDMIRIDEGKKVPVDGDVFYPMQVSIRQKGNSGNDAPHLKVKGNNVFSGAYTEDNSAFCIKATKSGSNGFLMKLFSKESKEFRFKISETVDKFSKVFFPVILSGAVVSAFTWFMISPWPHFPQMIQGALSVLLYACPCALGLAAPISLLLGSYRLLQTEILVTKQEQVEKLSAVTDIFFDKTGTLTYPSVDGICLDNTLEGDKILAIRKAVYSIEDKSQHPLAKGILRTKKINKLISPCEITLEQSNGITGQFEGKVVSIGNFRWMIQNQLVISKEILEATELSQQNGRTASYIAYDGKVVGYLKYCHEAKPYVKETIAFLKASGIRVHLLTGDGKVQSALFANSIGIPAENVHAELKPEDKSFKIEAVKTALKVAKKPCVTAFVGDHLNDVPASVAADVAISVGRDALSAKNCGIHLGDKFSLIELIIVSKAVVANIRQNLNWTLLYNFVGFIAVSGMLYPTFGIMASPWLASLGMTFSSLFVVFNSSRLTYEINYLIDLHYKRIPQPKNFLRQITNFFRYRTQLSLIKAWLADTKPAIPKSCDIPLPEVPSDKIIEDTVAPIYVPSFERAKLSSEGEVLGSDRGPNPKSDLEQKLTLSLSSERKPEDYRVNSNLFN